MVRIKHAFFVSLAASMLSFAPVAIGAQDTTTDKQVLQKISDKLATARTLKYRYKRELNYPSEGYLSETSADSFLDLKPVDSPAGIKYQFSSDDLLAIYN